MNDQEFNKLDHFIKNNFPSTQLPKTDWKKVCYDIDSLENKASFFNHLKTIFIPVFPVFASLLLVFWFKFSNDNNEFYIDQYLSETYLDEELNESSDDIYSEWILLSSSID